MKLYRLEKNGTGLWNSQWHYENRKENKVERMFFAPTLKSIKCWAQLAAMELNIKRAQLVTYHVLAEDWKFKSYGDGRTEVIIPVDKIKKIKKVNSKWIDIKGRLKFPERVEIVKVWKSHRKKVPYEIRVEVDKKLKEFYSKNLFVYRHDFPIDIHLKILVDMTPIDHIFDKNGNVAIDVIKLLTRVEKAADVINNTKEGR